MPGCSRQKNPRGVEILFEEDTHRYSSMIDGCTVEYVSGTTFVHDFFPKFDPTGEIAERCARREGMTVDEIRRKWKDNADRSCAFGTKIHETIEDVLKGDMIRNRPDDDREKRTMDVAVGLAKKILERMDIIGIEKIVFDPDIAIAGTMDLFGRAKKDGTLWILDHKTNKKIETFNRWGTFALSPIEYVPNTNYAQYTLQLNLYENILKRAGYVGKDERIEKALFHIQEEGFRTYRLATWQSEVESMISTRKREREN